MGMFVERLTQQIGDARRALEATDAEWETKFPALYDFMACAIGLGGKPRQTGSLTIFARTGSWHVCLKDKQTKKSWWAEGATVQAALESLDSQIQAG